ncbi:MAG: hypothetical protein LC132_08090 [Burkholderiales bacterium]|nr:hypothetical protein [Burkholderiales bacterium]
MKNIHFPGLCLLTHTAPFSCGTPAGSGRRKDILAIGDEGPDIRQTPLLLGRQVLQGLEMR